MNELAYSLFSRGGEFELFDLCQKNNIAVIGYSPLMQGLLTGKYDSLDQLDSYRTRTRHFSGKRERSTHGEEGCEEELLEALKDIKKIADEEGLVMAEMAIAWAFSHDAVKSVIPGCRNLKQTESAIRFFSFFLSFVSQFVFFIYLIISNWNVSDFCSFYFQNHRASKLQLSKDVIEKLNKATEPVKQKMGSFVDIYKSKTEQRSY